MPWKRTTRFLIAAFAVVPLVLGSDPPSRQSDKKQDLTAMSIEELTGLEVVSFRNKAQKLSRVAGAMYVITREQIQRSGLNSVPELLRLAPGINVAQVNSSEWAIGSRGPVGVYQARLLVLIDGRSIYTPIFSGVYWDMGMPLLEDIDRIEVIRGPGATIWGANAVLGVINIVTRNARDTDDTVLVTGGGGGQERAFGRVRFGGSSGNIHWRFHALAEDHAALSNGGKSDAGDDWSAEQAGFRADSDAEHSSWMLQGSVSMNPGNLTFVSASVAALGFVRDRMNMLNTTANLTGEYRRELGPNGELRLTMDLDHMRRQHTLDGISHTRTWNTDLRYDFTAGHKHSLSVGAGVRSIWESVPTTGVSHCDPPGMDYVNYNLFVQDEISLLPDRVYLTLGTKVEHNPFTKWGAEPSASLMWQINKHHSVWASGARALRTPSFIERTLVSPLFILPPTPQTGGLPIEVVMLGGAGYGNEAVTDFQLGYRADPTRWLALSISLYRDVYQHFRSSTPGVPVFQMLPIPSLRMPTSMSNLTDGNGKGIEGTITLQPLQQWKLEGSYTHTVVRTWIRGHCPGRRRLRRYHQSPAQPVGAPIQLESRPAPGV